MSLLCWSRLAASILSFYLISLELVEEKFLLSSSLDHTVCLWSRNGGVHLPGHLLSPISGLLVSPLSGHEFSEAKCTSQLKLPNKYH